MWRALENKVREFIGIEKRDPDFFVMHAATPYESDKTPRNYVIPWIRIPDDFLAACWHDIPIEAEHQRLYEIVADYMWSHSIIEREVILHTKNWMGRFIIEANTYDISVLVIET
jgi:hypothetical protein